MDSAVRPVMQPIGTVKPIVMQNEKTGKEEKVFRIVLEDGTENMLTKVGGSPRFLITYDKQPVATASQYYTLMAHEEVGNLLGEVMNEQGFDDRTHLIKMEAPRPWQRRWTIPLDKAQVVENRLGHKENYDIGFSITNSYDLSLALNVELSMMRMVCKNGLYLPIVTREGQIKHITSDNEPEVILGRLRDSMIEAIKNNLKSVNMVQQLANHTPTKPQMLEISRRLGLRKYESRVLLPKGIVYEFNKDKSYPVDVRLVGNEVSTEIDLLNAFTSLANQVQTASRKMDIQSRIYQLIVNSRGAELHGNQTVQA